MSIESEIFDHRLITINSDINSDMADLIMKELLLMDDDNSNPITIYINSPGGEVAAGLQIIDTMKMIHSKVITVNTATCASMAAVILSAGDERKSLPHARVMIHQISAGVDGNIQDMEITMRETARVNKETMTLLANNCGKTYDELIKDTIRDHWMNAEEAKAYGIIDDIYEPDNGKK